MKFALYPICISSESAYSKEWKKKFPTISSYN